MTNDDLESETKALWEEITGGMDGWAYMPPWGYIATYGCGGVAQGGIRCYNINNYN